MLQRRGKALLRRYEPRHGAAVAIDPGTGRVLCLVSYTREGLRPLGRDLFCRGIFPAASIIKIVVAAGAIEKAGLNAASILRAVGDNHTLYKHQLVENPRTYRKISFQEAFAYSVNPVFGRLGIFLLGAESLREYALRFGFDAKVPFELKTDRSRFRMQDSAYAVAEAASGFNQTTLISPLFGALMAACVSNGGQVNVPTIVDSVVQAVTGKRLYERQTALWRQPVKAETAAELAGMMQGVARFGTARKSFRYMKQSRRFRETVYGGKTGSVDMEGIGRVDWFTGFCRHRTDPRQHVAVGVVTVHGGNWTVHSSYIGAELMRHYVRNMQIAEQQPAGVATRDSTALSG